MNYFAYSALFISLSTLFLGAHEQKEPPIKAIIFDLDGTIVKTGAFWNKYFSLLLSRYGINLSAQDEQEFLERVKGWAPEEVCALVKDTYQVPNSLESMEQDCRELVVQEDQEDIPFVAGFKTFFAEVKNHSLYFAIGTNSTFLELYVLNQRAHLDDLFETICTKSDVENGKPAPDVYLLAAQKIGAQPAECIVIEDSASGVKAAKAAGMFCVGLAHGDKERVKEADLVVDGYEQIDIEEILSGVFTVTE